MRNSKLRFLSCLAFIALAISTNATNGQSFLTNGLVSFYPFNGNPSDAGGGFLNGTVQGAHATKDRFCNPNVAYAFDGISAYIHLPDSAGFKSQVYSISIWFLPERY